MAYQHIKVSTRGAAGVITLDRADKLNAYLPRMGEEIVDAFAELRDQDDVRGVILTGNGRAFCAGVDLDYVRGVAAGEIEPDGPQLGTEAFVRQWPVDALAYPKPIIAAVNGAAVGVGITMLLPCDVRLAAAGAKLRLNFTKLGMLPGLASTHLLPALVGAGKALDLILGGKTLLAEDAAEIGLVQDVYPPDELLDQAVQRVEAIAESRPEVIAAAKQLLREGAAAAATAAMQREQAASAALRR